MEVFLRHRTTQLFFAGNRRWVAKPAEAFKFETIHDAVERTQQENLRRMELLIGLKTILPLADMTSITPKK